MRQLWPDFVLELSAPDRFSTSPISYGASRLNHEAFDDSVEEHVAVVTVLCMCCEIFDCLRDLFRVQLTVYFSFRCIYHYLLRQSCLFDLFLRSLLIA